MRRIRASAGIAAALLLCGVATAGCGSSATTGAGGSSSTSAAHAASTAGSQSPLTIAIFQPYTGSDGFLGPQYSAMCDTVSEVVSDAGGVLGHEFKCAPFDSTSDPADALPVANRMIASASNLAFVLGPGEGAVTPASLPIIDNAKAVHDVGDADPRYDQQTSPYFFRMAPSDSENGKALALYAAHLHYTHVAAVFTNDQAAQTEIGPFRAEYKAQGGQYAANLTIAPGSASYRTEVSQVLSAKPDAIVMEMDAQTAATFLSEYSQLSGGHLPPILTSSADTDPAWIRAIIHAVGKQTLEQKVTWFQPNVPNGPGFATFKHALLSVKQPIQDRQQYIGSQYAEWGYDFGVMCALAMLEAKSTSSTTWAPYVRKIADGAPGAVTVSSFAAGKQAIEAGHQVHYIGATGPVYFDSHNNNFSPFSGFTFNGNPNNLVPTKGQITPAQLGTS